MLRSLSSLKKLRLVTAALVALTLVPVLTADFDAGSFSVEVLDVGQGDAILITTPENIRVLIDGGPGDNILPALGRALGPFSSRIDLLILTHPDADHLEGLIPVLKRYEVGMVLRTDAQKNSAVFSTFEKLIAEKQVPDERLFMGDKIVLGEETVFTVLWPPADSGETKPNEDSIVGQLSYKGYDFLLTGDIASSTENKIMNYVSGKYLRSEVLKVAHHGSRYSTSDTFVAAVAPQVAAVSAGTNNSYGHPTAEVLSRLSQKAAQVLRTDLLGTIKFTLEEEGLVVTTER